MSKKSQEARYNLDPGSFFVNRFWGRRPDGVAINEALEIVHILEFKRSTDRDEGTLHTHKKKCPKKPIFTNVKTRFEHIEVPAKLLDYFSRSSKSNINQSLEQRWS